MKNLISSLTEKPDPEIQILQDLFIILGYDPTNMWNPGLLLGSTQNCLATSLDSIPQLYYPF